MKCSDCNCSDRCAQNNQLLTNIIPRVWYYLRYYEICNGINLKKTSFLLYLRIIYFQANYQL